MQDLLAEQGIHATVVIPVWDCGSVLCHINGDLFVRAAYLGFNELYVVTTPERLEAKQKEFADLPKVRVVGF